MKAGKIFDISLNVATPLLLGWLIYVTAPVIIFPPAVRNYLPDALWAYALISTVLIIWDRVVNPTWIAIAFGMAVCFEWLQHLHVIGGTGDVKDVLAYLTAAIIALRSNIFFKIKLSFENPKS
jgi:hypothetical protein